MTYVFFSYEEKPNHDNCTETVTKEKEEEEEVTFIFLRFNTSYTLDK